MLMTLPVRSAFWMTVQALMTIVPTVEMPLRMECAGAGAC